MSAAVALVVLTGWLDGVVKLAGAKDGVWVCRHDGWLKSCFGVLHVLLCLKMDIGPRLTIYLYVASALVISRVAVIEGYHDV